MGVIYISDTQAELILKEAKSVVQPLHTEVKQVWSSGHHGGNSLTTEILGLQIVYSL